MCRSWLEEQGENSFAISAYCEKLLPMLREAEGRVWWMLTTLTDQVLGENPHMRYIDSFDVLEKPKAEPSFLLSQLPDKLREQGLELSTDPEAYLESYLGYKMEPNERPRRRLAAGCNGRLHLLCAAHQRLSECRQ